VVVAIVKHSQSRNNCALHCLQSFN